MRQVARAVATAEPLRTAAVPLDRLRARRRATGSLGERPLLARRLALPARPGFDLPGCPGWRG